MRRILAFAFRDMKDIFRDAILVVALLVPFLVSAVVRFGLPWVNILLVRELGFDLMIHSMLIRSILLLMTPMMLGMLMGLMILDERDENILTYFAVTPFRKAGYVLYRIASAVVLSFVFGYLVLVLTETEGINYIKIAPVVLMAALEAPIYALFLGAFAGNKVEGLALSKATGVFLFAPIISYVLKTPVRYLVCFVPPFWVAEAFLASTTDSALYWLYVVVGFAIHAGCIAWFANRFGRRID